MLLLSLLDSVSLPGGPQKTELWRPGLSVSAVVLGAIGVLTEPNPKSPANTDATIAFRK